MTESEAFRRLMAAAKEGRIESFALPGAPVPPGLPITPWRGDQVDALLCLLCDDAHPLLFLDNLVGKCAVCGGRVQFRPTAPAGPRHCLICAAQALG